MKRWMVVPFVVSMSFAVLASHPAPAPAAVVDDSLAASARRAVPAGISSAALHKGLEPALWNHERSAVAVSFARPKGSLVYVFLKQADGHYVAVDASRVEGGNFGKLGSRAADYDRVETRPVQWNRRGDGSFEVVMRTRARSWLGSFHSTSPL